MTTETPSPMHSATTKQIYKDVTACCTASPTIRFNPDSETLLAVDGGDSDAIELAHRNNHQSADDRIMK